jgi:hypothetical protein
METLHILTATRVQQELPKQFKPQKLKWYNNPTSKRSKRLMTLKMGLGFKKLKL